MNYDFGDDFENYGKSKSDSDDSENDSDCVGFTEEEIEEFENYFPKKEEIYRLIENSGLSKNTIIRHAKKGKKLKLLIPEGKDSRVTDENNPEYVSNYTEKKMIKDGARCFLNIFIISKPEKLIRCINSDKNLEEIMDKIEKEFRDKKECVASEDYFSWYKICLNIKFLEDSEKGLEMFKRFSSLSRKYDGKECEKLWNSSEPKYGSIGIILSTVYKKSSEKILDRKPNLNRKELLKK